MGVLSAEGSHEAEGSHGALRDLWAKGSLGPLGCSTSPQGWGQEPEAGRGNRILETPGAVILGGRGRRVEEAALRPGGEWV